MLADKNIHKISEAYDNMHYTYTKFPQYKLNKNYGIYINIPFYSEKCEHFIYYSENYNLNLEKEFLYCISKEITLKKFNGTIDWFYIDGIAPNSLSIYTLKNIINAVKNKVQFSSINMKVIESLLSKDKLLSFKEIGITKLCIVANDPEDKYSSYKYSINNLSSTIKKVVNANLDLNIQLVYGLSSNNEIDFINDVQILINSKTPEISLLPNNTLIKNKFKDVIENEELRIIEKCGKLLRKSGYKRTGLWTYSLSSTNNSYDLLKNMFSSNFLGLGPNAISHLNKYTIINPNISFYRHNLNTDNLSAFICYDQGPTKSLQNFIGTIYGANNLHLSSLAPNYISYMLLFSSMGYISKKELTPQGLYCAHKLMRHVIQNFPFPLRDSSRILNYNDYLRIKKDSGLF